MAIVVGDYITSPVPNTTLREYLRDGVLYSYVIAPTEGYLLHDKDLDMPEYDENLGTETGNIIPWFTGVTTNMRPDYDFTNTTQGTYYTYTDENGMEITIPVTMIGEREFYTVPTNIVPYDQILGGGGNNHE